MYFSNFFPERVIRNLDPDLDLTHFLVLDPLLAVGLVPDLLAVVHVLGRLAAVHVLGRLAAALVRGVPAVALDPDPLAVVLVPEPPAVVLVLGLPVVDLLHDAQDLLGAGPNAATPDLVHVLCPVLDRVPPPVGDRHLVDCILVVHHTTPEDILPLDDHPQDEDHGHLAVCEGTSNL